MKDVPESDNLVDLKKELASLRLDDEPPRSRSGAWLVNPAVARLRDSGARFRNDILSGPGGKQILLLDPPGNVVELFEPAALTTGR